MPVEIKELIIRAVATEEPVSPAGAKDAPGGPPGAAAPQIPPADTEAIIAACVKRVLKILQQSKDR